MMKKSTLVVALSAALLSMSAAQASEFSGGFVGIKAGNNQSDVAGANTALSPSLAKQNATTYGLEGGYNWDVNSFLLGVTGFANFNKARTHVATPAPAVSFGSDTYGLDLKVGLPSGNWLPYAKLGMGSTRATGGQLTGTGQEKAHAGLGVEYKFAPHWSLAGEYTTSSSTLSARKLTNNNLTIGINYYFDSPYVAPAAVAAVAAVVAAPKAAPAPVAEPAAPSETWKTLLEEKPVTLKGTNFEFDSAKLGATADSQLNEVAEFAAAYSDAKLDVSGHTDSIGTDAYNQKLSERRANSVKSYLVKKGVAADRIVAVGMGESMPVASNKTKSGRADNRRVEIRSVIKSETKVRVIH